MYRENMTILIPKITNHSNSLSFHFINKLESKPYAKQKYGQHTIGKESNTNKLKKIYTEMIIAGGLGDGKWLLKHMDPWEEVIEMF